MLGETPLMWLCILLGVLAVNEVLNLTCGRPKTGMEIAERIIELLSVGTLIYFLSFAAFSPDNPRDPIGEFFVMIFNGLATFAIVTLFLLRVVLTVFDKSEHALKRCTYAIFGYAYTVIPLTALLMLSSRVYLNYDFRIPLILFIMIWLNDTGAYCVGSTLGRHRLCERLSPKKSWEGFWGGLVFAMGAGAVYALLCDPERLTVWLGAGAVVGVAATVGDLFESLIKRTAGVKDSGKLIPGHGGILDRIDSLLFAAPTLMLYLTVCF